MTVSKITLLLMKKEKNMSALNLVIQSPHNPRYEVYCVI